VLLGGVAKVNSTLVIMLRNTSLAFLASLPMMDLKPSHLVITLRNANKHFLAPLPVMNLKPPHLVITLRNANKHFWRHCREGHRFKMKHLAWHKQ
jgi:hypothetical protein